MQPGSGGSARTTSVCSRSMALGWSSAATLVMMSSGFTFSRLSRTPPVSKREMSSRLLTSKVRRSALFLTVCKKRF